MSKRNENELSSWLVTAVYLGALLIGGFALWLLTLVGGNHLPLSFSDLSGDSISAEGLGKVWFIFAFALISVMIAWGVQGPSYTYMSRSLRFIKGMWVSLNAGVFEELLFRWMAFFSAIIVLQFLNWISRGLVKWFFTEIMIPITNFFTFHALDTWLNNDSSWAIGAAIISASALFRDAHSQHGAWGKVVVWYVGIAMFYLTLNYGIQTAMFAHFAYDAIIIGISAVVTKRQTDWQFKSQRKRFTPIVWNTGWERPQ